MRAAVAYCDETCYADGKRDVGRIYGVLELATEFCRSNVGDR